MRTAASARSPALSTWHGRTDAPRTRCPCEAGALPPASDSSFLVWPGRRPKSLIIPGGRLQDPGRCVLGTPHSPLGLLPRDYSARKLALSRGENEPAQIREWRRGGRERKEARPAVSSAGAASGVQNGHFVQFNSDGTVNHVLTGVTAGPSLGMWGNPVDGHITTSSAGLIDIDPLAGGRAGSFRVIPFPAGNGDGVSVSPDGKTAYVEQGGQINGHDTATGALVFQSGPLAGAFGADGSGVISSHNSLNGVIIVNFNSGDVGLIDPATKASPITAMGAITYRRTPTTAHCFWTIPIRKSASPASRAAASGAAATADGSRAGESGSAVWRTARTGRLPPPKMGKTMSRWS